MTITVVKGLDEKGQRISSMEFEKLVRSAAAESASLCLESYGQHNIGIRLQREDGLDITVKGPSGQRLGCMGLPGTSMPGEPVGIPGTESPLTSGRSLSSRLSSFAGTCPSMR